MSEAGKRASNTATADFESVKQLLKKIFRPRRATAQETQVDRLSHVSHIALNPPKHVLYQQQRLPFNSIATDYQGRTIQGIRFTYSSSDPTKLTVDEMGVATGLQPGIVWLTSTAGSVTARVPILVLAGTRSIQTDAQWAADQTKLNPDGTLAPSGGGGMASFLQSIVDKLAPTVYAQSGGGDSGDFGYDELWSDPRNSVGHPGSHISQQTNIGTVLPEGSNFELSIPMLSSPGRGVPVNLSLNYNSRIWSRHGNAVTFNAVNSWPYLGFNLSFGRIVTYGSDPNTKFMLVDPDGTRHYLGSGQSGQVHTYQTNDGTHITYVGNATSGGTIYYTNGTSMAIYPWNNRLLVSSISDSNGNSVTIGYANQQQPSQCNNGLGFQWHQAISSISDTRGCLYSFVYDSCNNLVAIQAPGQGGTSQNPVTITVAQFNYTSQSISSSFSGLTVENVPFTSIPVLSSIYFPVSQTGYTFTYSAYGIIYNVSKRRQMSVDQNGNISAGVESAHATFNYPTTASSLTDAPAFTQRTESPGSANPFVYYVWPPNMPGPNQQTVQITAPDAASNPGYPVHYMIRSSDPASPANGLLIQSDTANYGGTYFESLQYTYANDPGGSPQLQSLIRHDDTGAMTQVNYDYDQYGNLNNQREFGYQVSGVWDVRRRTHYTYVTDPNYLNAHLCNLVTEKDVYDAQLNTNDADDILIAKSTYQYDNYSVMGNMENYGGNYSGSGAPPGYNNAYNNQALTVRGNLTTKSDYSDVVNQIAEAYNNKIDIFGNVAQAQVPCCNLNTYTFTVNTYWTMPDQTIKGDPNGIHLTKLITHDFNTQQTTALTDPNNLQTTFAYDNSGRPTTTTVPTNAQFNTTYNDGNQTATASVSYSSGGASISASASGSYDGWSRTTQSINPNSGQVNTTYDPLGRVTSQTNPFPAGGSPGPSTTFAYDPLGRTTAVTLSDNNTLQTSYSGNTVTTTDQVGRKLQKQADGLGWLVTVTEQDSAGNLTQSTTYSYDLLGNLTQVNQGGQIRSFKYDALSRKLYEAIPEMSATINDGTGTMWSMKYNYTSFNAALKNTDPRGVEKHFKYDSLNRLVQIWYTGLGGDDAGNVLPPLPSTVRPTNGINITYDTSSTSTTKGMLLAISMTGSLPTYQENFSYDSVNEISSRTWSRDGQSYTVGYQHNQDGQLTQLTYPSTRVVTVNYDGSGRLSSLTDPNQGSPVPYLSNIAYNAAGQITVDTMGYVTPINESFGFDSQRMQLTSQTATKSGGGQNGLMNLNYSYQAGAGQMGTGTTAGNAGQLMAINNNSTINGTAESAAYTYDLEGRLVTSSQTTNGSTAQRRFAYDRWGNRTGMWDATSGGNQLQTITLAQSGGVTTNAVASVTGNGAGSYTYDAAGNLTADGSHTYQYDAESRLRGLDGSDVYSYDYQNRRIKKVIGSASTHYIWDGDHVLAEHNASNGAQIVDYVYAGTKLIGEGPGNVLGGNGTFTFLLSDRLSTRVSLDKYANVLGRQAHLPFGEEFAESGTQEKHHFTSYENDSESGTDYAENRQYGQVIGRFMRVDPIDGRPCKPQSWNRFAYTMGDPVNATDPTGLFCPGGCPVIGGVCTCPDPDPGGGGGGGGGVPCPPNVNSASCGGGGGGGGGGQQGLSAKDCQDKLAQFANDRKGLFENMKVINSVLNFMDHAAFDKIDTAFADQLAQLQADIRKYYRDGNPTMAQISQKYTPEFHGMGIAANSILSESNPPSSVGGSAGDALNDILDATALANEMTSGGCSTNPGLSPDERRAVKADLLESLSWSISYSEFLSALQ